MASSAQDATGTLTEGVLSVIQHTLRGCKSHSASFPFGLALLFLYVDAATIAAFIVDDDVVRLAVALTGTEHHGTGILKHRGEIGRHERLRQQVLAGAIERGTLPLPAHLVVLVVTSVTGRDGKMPSLESFTDGVGARGIAHPRLSGVRCLAP